MRIRITQDYSETTFGPSAVNGNIWKIHSLEINLTGTSTANTSLLITIERNGGINYPLYDQSTTSTTTSIAQYYESGGVSQDGVSVYQPYELLPGDTINISATNNGTVNYCFEIEDFLDGEIP